MNGTSTRTRRTVLCRSVHSEMPEIPYKRIVSTAREMRLTSPDKDSRERLIAALRA
jgi:hypothetical protein